MKKSRDRSNRSFRRNKQRREAREERERAESVEEVYEGRKVDTYTFGNKTYDLGPFILDLISDNLDVEEDKDCLEALIAKGEKAGLGSNYGRKFFKEMASNPPEDFKLDARYELGKLIFVYQEIWSLIEPVERQLFEKVKYNFKKIKEMDGYKGVIRARAFAINHYMGSTGNGDYRYMFDKNTHKYLGVAKHQGDKGKQRFTWA